MRSHARMVSINLLLAAAAAKEHDDHTHTSVLYLLLKYTRSLTLFHNRSTGVYHGGSFVTELCLNFLF